MYLVGGWRELQPQQEWVKQSFLNKEKALIPGYWEETLKPLTLRLQTLKLTNPNLKIMAKTEKQKEARNFEIEYDELMLEFPVTPFTPVYPEQWKASGDYFVKFSMYKETHSGRTSSNTSYIQE